MTSDPSFIVGRFQRLRFMTSVLLSPDTIRSCREVGDIRRRKYSPTLRFRDGTKSLVDQTPRYVVGTGPWHLGPERGSIPQTDDERVGMVSLGVEWRRFPRNWYLGSLYFFRWWRECRTKKGRKGEGRSYRYGLHNVRKFEVHDGGG